MKEKTKQFLTYSLDLLRYKKHITFLNIFCNAIIFCRWAAVSYIVRQVLNILESSQGRSMFLARPYLLALLAVVLIRIAAIMGCAKLDTLRSYYYQNRVRLNLIKLLLKKPDITGVAGHSGPVFEVLSNDIPISTFPCELLTEVTGYFIFTLIAVYMLISINWQLTLFIFIPLSFAIYGIQSFTDRMKERRHANRASQDTASLFVSDVADTVLAVKAAGAEEPILRRFMLVNKNRRTAVLKDALLNSRIDILLNGSVHAGSAIMMFAAASLMANGKFGLGDFSFFIVHLGTLADCVRRIVELIAESRRAEVSYERIMAAAETDNSKYLNADAGITLRRKIPERQELPGQKPLQLFEALQSFEALQLFEVKDLSYDYGDGKGFRNISFTAGPGELVAIKGGVASGKSTFISVLMGLLPPFEGQIFLNNRKIGRNNETAGTPQRTGFFSASLRENISMGLPVSDDDIFRALRLASLDEMISKDALDIDLGSRGNKISGGQQQRLSLARMFIRKVPVYIIDDCVSALDGETKMKVLVNIKNFLRQNASAAVIATNEQAFINAADQVLTMTGAG